jgi:hypothetical protein
MRAFLTALAGTVLLSAAPALAKPRLSPEAELTKLIGNRVAGEPVKCITLSNVRSVRIIDRTALVYEQGSTLYVNRPRGGAEHLNQWDTLVTQPFAGRLCRPDIVRLYDSGSRFESGWLSLGDFVPYRRVRQAR